MINDSSQACALTKGTIGPENEAPANNNAPTKAKATFVKKENATLAQRIEILDWHNANGLNQTKTARFFDQKYPNL